MVLEGVVTATISDFIAFTFQVPFRVQVLGVGVQVSCGGTGTIPGALIY